MAREVSALNTYWIVQYLKERHPDINLDKLVDRLVALTQEHVENLQTGRRERITLAHLQTPRYWFSHHFVKTFFDLILETIPDPKIGYKMGATIYKTQPVIKTTVGLSLLGVHRVALKVTSESAKFNRTKTYCITKLDKGYIRIRITHNPGIVINTMTMEWNAGCFASYAKLAGATDVQVDLHCIAQGPTNPNEKNRAIWDFEIRYRDPGFFTRVGKAILYALPWVRELTERAEQLEIEHQEQIFDRDNIIRIRTEQLLSIQEKLIAEERNTIEKKLKEISMELVNTEERERRSIAEGLHDSVTQLISFALARLKSSKLPKESQEQLTDIREYLEQALLDLRSFTFQISPPVLYDFGLEAALKWLVTDINERHGMRLKFVNLIHEPLEQEQQQKVILYRAVRELIINILKHGRTKEGGIELLLEDSLLKIRVEDRGVGFTKESIQNGYGLHSLKERLSCLNGKLCIDSTPGKGTVATISMLLR